MIIKIPRNQVEIIEVGEEGSNEGKFEDELDNRVEHNPNIINRQCPLTAQMKQEYLSEASLFETQEKEDELEMCAIKVENEPKIENIVMHHLEESSSDSEHEAKRDTDWTPCVKEEDVTEDEEENLTSDSDYDYQEKRHVRGRSKKQTKPKIKRKNTKVVHEHQCNYCEKSFTFNPALVRHINTYHLFMFKCKVCDMNFASKYKLSSHKKEKHGQMLLFCPICQEEFTCVEDINTHTRKYHGSSAHICSTCDKVYTSEKCLKTHLKLCARGIHTTLSCEMCGKVYTTKSTMENHLKVHMNVVYTCKDCGKTFSHARNMYRHRDIEHLGKVYKCEPCNKNFADDRGLIKHNKIVHKAFGGMPKKYVCTFCPNKYWEKITLLRHLKNYHYDHTNSMKKKLRPVTLICNNCNKTFRSKNSIRSHMEIVHCRNHACHKCGSIFSSKTKLEDHESKPHIQCDHCEKVFPNKRAFQVHVREITNLVMNKYKRTTNL